MEVIGFDWIISIVRTHFKTKRKGLAGCQKRSHQILAVISQRVSCSASGALVQMADQAKLRIVHAGAQQLAVPGRVMNVMTGSAFNRF